MHHSTKIIVWVCVGSFVFWVAWLLWVQFHPSFGNVWIRCGRFQPTQALGVMGQTLKKMCMWHADLLMFNWIVWVATGGILGGALGGALGRTTLGENPPSGPRDPSHAG